MKKSILIFGTLLVGLSLMAFSYLNRNKAVAKSVEETTEPAPLFEYDLTDIIGPIKQSDLVYRVGSRNIHTISEADLLTVKSVTDILPKQEFQSKGYYRNIQISMYQDGKKVTEVGDDALLNEAQIKLLQSAGYSGNIQVSALYEYEQTAGRNRSYDAVMSYVSVVPQEEAKFMEGDDALIQYLKENSKALTTNIYRDKLKSGQFSFTVTKEGTIDQVKLRSTSGYESIDQAFLDLIKAMPGKWEPAIDAKGNKIDRELIFFFGLEGC